MILLYCRIVKTIPHKPTKKSNLQQGGSITKNIILLPLCICCLLFSSCVTDSYNTPRSQLSTQTNCEKSASAADELSGILSETSQYEKPQPEPDDTAKDTMTENNAVETPKDTPNTIEEPSAMQYRDISFTIVDKNGSPIPNMSVLLIQQDGFGEGWGEWSRTDLSGNTHLFKDVPIDSMFISIENDAIPYSNPDRFFERILSAEEFSKMPKENIIVWDKMGYREAVDNAPVCIGFRVYDENNNLIPMARVELYAKQVTNNEEKSIDDYYESSGTYGYTEEDGIFLFAFPDSTLEARCKSPYVYTAKVSYNGKKGEGTLSQITQRVNIVDIVIR